MAGDRSIGLFDFTAFKTAVISGGAAGDHTVTGIAADDQLVEVIYFAGAGSDVTDVADLTSEFTISAIIRKNAKAKSTA